MISKIEFAVVINMIFICRTNFMLSWVEHEKSFITSGPILWLEGVVVQADMGLHFCLKDIFSHGMTQIMLQISQCSRQLSLWPTFWDLGWEHMYSGYIFKFKLETVFLQMSLFVCVEVLQSSQPNGVMLSTVSLPNHTYTGQAKFFYCCDLENKVKVTKMKFLKVKHILTSNT